MNKLARSTNYFAYLCPGLFLRTRSGHGFGIVLGHVFGPGFYEGSDQVFLQGRTRFCYRIRIGFSIGSDPVLEPSFPYDRNGFSMGSDRIGFSIGSDSVFP